MAPAEPRPPVPLGAPASASPASASPAAPAGGPATPGAPRLLLDDLPELRTERWWPGLDELAVRVVRVLDAPGLDAPVLLTGPWGAGKTTLLRAIEARLDPGRVGPDRPARRTLWFDAWRHETEGELLPGLVRAVWEQIPDGRRQSPDAQRVWSVAWRAAAAVGLLSLPAVGALFGGAPGALAGKVLADKVNARAIQDAAAAVGLKQELIDDAPPPVDRLTALQKALGALLDLGWPAAEHPRGPVLLIDDLDRCSPVGAVALLDQLRALLARQAGDRPLRLRFLLAMDREVLARAVAARFRGPSGDADYDGNRFLEKLFPVAFAVPAPEGRALQQLIQGFVRDTAPADGRSGDWQDALLSALNDPLFNNPRLIKRCVNRFRLVTAFEAEPGAPPRPDDDADRLLARWIAATERWPELRRWMQEQGDEWWRQLSEHLGAPAAKPAPAEAAPLMAQRGVQAWLRRELFATASRSRVPAYREADRRLRRWGL